MDVKSPLLRGDLNEEVHMKFHLVLKQIKLKGTYFICMNPCMNWNNNQGTTSKVAILIVYVDDSVIMSHPEILDFGVWLERQIK